MDSSPSVSGPSDGRIRNGSQLPQGARATSPKEIVGGLGHVQEHNGAVADTGDRLDTPSPLLDVFLQGRSHLRVALRNNHRDRLAVPGQRDIRKGWRSDLREEISPQASPSKRKGTHPYILKPPPQSPKVHLS